MSETKTIYNTETPTKAQKLLSRICQVANQRKGQNDPLVFTVIVHPDGRWELIAPPLKAEQLGVN